MHIKIQTSQSMTNNLFYNFQILQYKFDMLDL